MNSKRNNGWHNGADAIGVTDMNPGGTPGPPHLTGEAFASIPFEPLGEDADKTGASNQREHRAPRRRNRLVGGVFFLLVLAVGGTGLWMMSGSNKTRVNVPVRDTARGIDSSAARNNDDVTAQAIAEVRGAIAAPAPAASTSPPPATSTTGATEATRTIVMPTTPVTVPLEGVGGTSSPAATEATTGQRMGASSTLAERATKPGGIISERNPERSIRCAPIPAPVTVQKSILDTPANTKLPERAVPVLLRRSEPRVVLPSFGAMLPVRTLGALYTLRQSLVRFELLRDVRGDGWQMKKGLVLVGQQQGSDYDRAYVSLVGLIDPESKRFVKVTGEVLGADGAPGLQGKRRQISNRWARVLGRAATSAVSLGQAALSRGNSTTVILPGTVAPELAPSLNVVSRREFVEVGAGTPAFVMITDLPQEAKGVDAEPGTDSKGNGLSDEELARLLESGSPEKIRAAIPRMSPELRQIAETVLKEQ